MYSFFFIIFSLTFSFFISCIKVYLIAVSSFLFQPLWWEYIWCTSLLLSFLALSAIKRNRLKTLQKYMISILVLGLGPLIYAIVYYFKDVWTYLTVGKSEDIHLWQVFEDH